MIANNIWKAINDFFVNVFFSPYDAIRSMDNWWIQNTVSWIFVSIGFIAFFYWLAQLRKFKKADTQ